MPKKFPEEFKRDVVRVARRGDLTLAEVATALHCSSGCSVTPTWLHEAFPPRTLDDP